MNFRWNLFSHRLGKKRPLHGHTLSKPSYCHGPSRRTGRPKSPYLADLEEKSAFRTFALHAVAISPNSPTIQFKKLNSVGVLFEGAGDGQLFNGISDLNSMDQKTGNHKNNKSQAEQTEHGENWRDRLCYYREKGHRPFGWQGNRTEMLQIESDAEPLRPSGKDRNNRLPSH